MANVENVTTGKPRTSGAVFRAPKGTTLPTDAKTALADAFKALGYLSADGMTNSNKLEADKTKAWGGDVVLVIQKGKEDTFKFKMIESMNTEVLKAVYGDDNVSGAISSGITIKANSTEVEENAWVFDMVLRGGALKRIVIPSAGVTEIGDIIYKDEEATGYEVTLTATPDSSGNTHYEYIRGKTTTSQ